MPALPTVLAQSAGGIVGVPNVQVTNNAIAGGLAKAAGDVEQLDAKIQQANERDGRIWATRRNAELRASLLKAGTEREMSGEPLDGFGSWYETAAKEAYATALNDAPNDFARMYLDNYSVDAVSSFGETGLRKEADYRTMVQMDALDTTFSTLQNLAAQDPGNAEKYADQMQFALDGVPLPLEQRLKFKDAGGKVLAAAVAGRIESDPYGGLAMAQDFQARNLIDADTALTFVNRAQAGIKSREAEARARAAEGRAAAAEAANDYLSGADDYFAYRAAGNPPDAALEAKYSPEAIAALPIKGAEKMAKKASDALVRGNVFLSLRENPTPENMARIQAEANAAAADPENYSFNAETARMVASTVNDFQTALNKTPGEVAWQSGRVQDAIKSGNGVSIVAASLAEQERLDVPSWKRQPLSESYAASLAEQISALPPDQQAGAVQELATSYGSYWPDVSKQVLPKLPGALAVAAVMPPGRAATRLAEAASVPVADLKVGLDKDVSDNIETAMRDDERLQSLSATLASQVGGAKTLAQYNDAIMRSAFQYVREGKSEAEAVAQATIDVTEDIDFRDVGLSTVAIPKASNPDMVEAGMNALVSQIDVSTIDLPQSVSGMNEADLKAAYASSIRRNGQWVPDGTGKGVFLYVEGDPVTEGGQPKLFTWDELKAAGLPQGGFMFEGQR
jgi:hypothetical protein